MDVKQNRSRSQPATRAPGVASLTACVECGGTVVVEFLRLARAARS